MSDDAARFRARVGASLVATGALCAACVCALPRTALAADAPPDPRCSGLHGLWAPLPDECFGTIDTDRPHQTDTPHVVPAGHTQVESAVASVAIGPNVNEPHGPRDAHLLLFDDEYRFGLVSRVDLDLLMRHADYDLASRSFEPPGPLSVRLKWNFVEGDGIVPAVTFVPWIFVPMAPPPAESLRGGPLLFFAWELPLHLELEVNTGVLFSERPKPAGALVAASALTWNVLRNVGIFVDAYATGWDIALGTGALWAFTRDMQMDIGTYVGLSGAEPRATPFVGFSIRR